MAYSEHVLEHFVNPRNVGALPDANGVAVEGNPACGDSIRVAVRVEHGRLAEVRFLVKGCPSAVAVGSYLCSLVEGGTLEEAWRVEEAEVARALDLSPEKRHCSVVGVAALRGAMLDYRRRLRRGDDGGWQRSWYAPGKRPIRREPEWPDE